MSPHCNDVTNHKNDHLVAVLKRDVIPDRRKHVATASSLIIPVASIVATTNEKNAFLERCLPPHGKDVTNHNDDRLVATLPNIFVNKV